MKIAIPTRDCRIDDHFGHCDHYTIYTIENKTIAAREELPSPQGCGCKSGIAADLCPIWVLSFSEFQRYKPSQSPHLFLRENAKKFTVSGLFPIFCLSLTSV